MQLKKNLPKSKNHNFDKNEKMSAFQGRVYKAAQNCLVAKKILKNICRWKIKKFNLEILNEDCNEFFFLFCLNYNFRMYYDRYVEL